MGGTRRPPHFPPGSPGVRRRVHSFESATLRPRGFAMGLVHGHPAPEEILGERFQHTAREVADRVTRRGVSCRERRIGPDDDERRGRQRLHGQRAPAEIRGHRRQRTGPLLRAPGDRAQRASASGPTALDETLGGPSAERTLDGLLHTDEGLGPDEEKATVAVPEPAAAVVGQSAEQQSRRHLIARRHR